MLCTPYAAAPEVKAEHPETALALQQGWGEGRENPHSSLQPLCYRGLSLYVLRSQGLF